jgi:predicted dehydrogenase
MSARRLRFGMVGGGAGAFAGPIHRYAAQVSQRAQLVAGAFSADPALSRAAGADLGLDSTRVYENAEQMVEAEARRQSDERLDFVVIVTPTGSHAELAISFLKRGFNVVCDKPMAATLAQAELMATTARATNKILAVTYNYSGNEMVLQARELIRQGVLGEIRTVIAEYLQGWLAEPWEERGLKQAVWRMDPARSGGAGCLADLGVHAWHLLRFVTGLQLQQVCATLAQIGRGREVPDDAIVLAKFAGGVRGSLHCSQVSAGEENNLSLRVCGSRATLEWRQESPDELILKHPDRPREIRRRGNAYNLAGVPSMRMLPAGHPAGFLDAFSCIYRQILDSVHAEVTGSAACPLPQHLSAADALEDMRFVDAALRSTRGGGLWVAPTEVSDHIGPGTGVTA